MKNPVDFANIGFNPCSGGLWLLRQSFNINDVEKLWFQSLFWWIMVAKNSSLCSSNPSVSVSILVLVDYGC